MAGGVLICALLLGSGIFVSFFRPESERFSGEFMIGGGSFIGILLLNAAFGASDIVASEVGLSWSIFLWKWRVVGWENIKSIRADTFHDFEKKRSEKKYSMELKGKKPIYPINFDDTLDGVDDLKKILEFYSKEFGYFCDFGADEPRGRDLTI